MRHGVAVDTLSWLGEGRTGTPSGEAATDFAAKFPPRFFGSDVQNYLDSSSLIEAGADIRRRQYGSNAGGQFRLQEFLTCIAILLFGKLASFVSNWRYLAK
jgi:hypothetical protein